MDIYSLQQSQLLAQILMLLDSSFVLCSCSSPIRFHDTICRFDATTPKLEAKNRWLNSLGSNAECYAVSAPKKNHARNACIMCFNLVLGSCSRIFMRQK